MGRMRWRWISVAGLATAVVVGGPVGPATGQEPSSPPTTTTTTTTTTSTSTTRPVAAVPSVEAVAAAIIEDGWYAHPEAVGDREQLDRVADRLSDRHEIGFALLADEPPGSSTRFAEEVLDEVILLGLVGDRNRPWSSTTTATTAPGATTSTSVFRYVPRPDIRTVVVLSDADVGVVSDLWGDDAIDAALDETIDELRADPTDGLEALADALADQPIGDDDPDEGDEVPYVVIAVALLGLLAAAQIVYATVRATGEGFVDDGGDGDGDGDQDDDGGSGGRPSRRRRYNQFVTRPFSSGSRGFGGGGSRSSGGGGGGSRGRGGRRL